MKKNALLLACGITIIMSLPQVAVAAPSSITYAHKHFLFTLYPHAYAWRQASAQWFYKDRKAQPAFCLPECDGVAATEGWSKKEVETWDREAIQATITEKIAAEFEREADSVTIGRNGSGNIVFVGRGLPGRKIDMELAVDLTITALTENINHVVLPVTETQPIITIEDDGIEGMGIREVVSVGESDFAGSPNNRKHNIAVGLSKFNGVIIPKGATFSFNDILGPVNAEVGYKRELVILGEHTLPDYGGGLCQVSSTAYRGIWEYGFPIDERKNHSYIVTYYSPQGTDATVYPPNVDVKFTNDSPGPLLIQTFTDENDHAYFVYYGMRDDRTSEVLGPFTWGMRAAPEEKKIEYTTDIPPGTERKVGSKVPGMTTSWFRIVKRGEEEPDIYETYSLYEARPLFYQIGVTQEELAKFTGENTEPDWLPNSD